MCYRNGALLGLFKVLTHCTVFSGKKGGKQEFCNPKGEEEGKPERTKPAWKRFQPSVPVLGSNNRNLKLSSLAVPVPSTAQGTEIFPKEGFC